MKDTLYLCGPQSQRTKARVIVDTDFLAFCATLILSDIAIKRHQFHCAHSVCDINSLEEFAPGVLQNMFSHVHCSFQSSITLN